MSVLLRLLCRAIPVVGACLCPWPVDGAFCKGFSDEAPRTFDSSRVRSLGAFARPPFAQEYGANSCQLKRACSARILHALSGFTHRSFFKACMASQVVTFFKGAAQDFHRREMGFVDRKRVGKSGCNSFQPSFSRTSQVCRATDSARQCSASSDHVVPSAERLLGGSFECAECVPVRCLTPV